MASRRSFFLPSLPRLLLLVAKVLGAVLLLLLHGEGAMAGRPLLGIAEPPASPGAVAAAGPGPGLGPAALPVEGGRPDRSEAGAEVILAGFAAAVIVVIFCYIRVTRESSSSSSSSGVGVGEKHESLGGF